ncbi:hypothetical protein OJ996_22280 [Luteolibacter sp. GHJ8]|uniref:Uncharacterized protein n=1 Tax=Luteolibacter rhizosphaerae TaxID=2989719 RepID=A0ABT3G8Z9_9BACT|nr:hypothetical protein [Luteolibacter rhizosphaerae]MCW1916333.1 hypothetical protein [Luteolibacter rhizosphaerae]
MDDKTPKDRPRAPKKALVLFVISFALALLGGALFIGRSVVLPGKHENFLSLLRDCYGALICLAGISGMFYLGMKLGFSSREED